MASTMDFASATRELIVVAQKVLSKEEYASDDKLMAYTKAILYMFANSSKNKAKYKTKAVRHISERDIKMGFSKLHSLHAKDIETSDFSWLINVAVNSALDATASVMRDGGPISITIGEKDTEFAYPVSKVYSILKNDEELGKQYMRKFEYALISCVKNSLQSDDDQKDAIDDILKAYSDVIPESANLDIKEIYRRVMFISNRFTSHIPSDFFSKPNLISALIEVLREVEGDKELTDNVRYLADMARSDKFSGMKSTVESLMSEGTFTKIPNLMKQLLKRK